MMKRAKTLINGLLLIMFIGLLYSCRHKELVYPDAERARLDVKFDWSNAQDADPSAMAFYLYDLNSANPIRFIFQNKTGGQIHVPSGEYFALCLNADLTDWAVIEHEENMDGYKISTLDSEQLETLGISTRVLPRAPESETERMAATPGMLWSFVRRDISIPVAYERQTIMMYPEEKVCHYVVDVYPTEGISLYSAGVDATLSGMAEGYLSGADNPSEDKVTHTYHLSANFSTGSLHSEFLTFGTARSDAGHYVSLYLVDSSGKGRNINVDVSDQVNQAPDPKHVHIVINGIDLPEPHHDEVGMGGFQPDVDDWQSVNITLHMR